MVKRSPNKTKVKREKRTYDKAYVKDFLENKFRSQRTKKPFWTYKQLVKIHEQYPKTIRDIVYNIHVVGYWKDCFFLLLACLALKKDYKTSDLEDYIYNHLINTLQKDIQKDRKNKKITTLGKWLPREKSAFDKKIKFVRQFTDRMFPHVEDPKRRRAIYRKICANLNKRISTVEIKLSNNDIEKINFELISRKALENNKERLLKNEICRWKMNEALYNKYSSMDLWQLAKLLNKEIHDFDRDIIKRAWKSNARVFAKKILFLGDLKNTQLIIDTSNDLFKEGWIYIIIAIVLLRLEKGNDGDIFVVGKPKPIVFKDLDIFKVANTVIKNCYAHKQNINYELKSDKRIIEISTKKIDQKVDFHWQLTKEFPIQIGEQINDGPNIKGLPFISKSMCHEKIKNIINKSKELEATSYFQYYKYCRIFILIMALVTTYLYLFVY